MGTYPIDGVACNYNENNVEESEAEGDHAADGEFSGRITSVSNINEVVILEPPILTLHYSHRDRAVLSQCLRFFLETKSIFLVFLPTNCGHYGSLIFKFFEFYINIYNAKKVINFEA